MTRDDTQEYLRAAGLLPHQAELVVASLEMPAGGRLFVFDQVGLGKTEAAVGLLNAWKRQTERLPRTLVVAPGSLSFQWLQRLDEEFGAAALRVDAKEFRHLEARSDESQNPWASVTIAVTSPSFLGRDKRGRLAGTSDWDFVILDEAHRVEQMPDGAELLHELWAADNIRQLVAISATPRRDGALERLARMGGRPTRVFRRASSGIRGWNGEPVFRESSVRVVRLNLSPEERAVLELIRQNADARSAGDLRVAAKNLARAASSSLFAAEQLVLRSLTRSPSAGASGNRPERESDDDYARSVSTSAEEAQWVYTMHEVLAALQNVSWDSKYAALGALFSEVEDALPHGVVVFTDFADTAEYLASSLASQDEFPVFAMTGSTPPYERDSVVTEFHDSGGILVLTSSAALGFELSFSRVCVHYDLPSSRSILEQRQSRLLRLGGQLPELRQFVLADRIDEVSARRLFALTTDAPPKSVELDVGVLTDFDES